MEIGIFKAWRILTAHKNRTVLLSVFLECNEIQKTLSTCKVRYMCNVSILVGNFPLTTPCAAVHAWCNAQWLVCVQCTQCVCVHVAARTANVHAGVKEYCLFPLQQNMGDCTLLTDYFFAQKCTFRLIFKSSACVGW